MKQKHSYLGILFLIICLITVQNKVFAQAKNTVSGKVLDETGQSIPGANVSLKDTGKNTITDENGRYVFTDVIAGNYIVEATNVGYKTYSKEISVKKENL